jgi:hypothetical protein
MKSGYYVDEGMTLFLSNGHYNGAVTSKSEYGINDFIATYIIREGDSVSDIFKNITGMLSDLVNSGNYSQEGTVQWYDAARRMLQGTTTWIEGGELFDELVAEKGGRFQYAQVYMNQALDVHPTVYYMLVHTIFSFFPGVYSDNFLFAVNILFLVLTCILMYIMLKSYYNEYAAWISVIVFGFSQGFASCAVYFRMYAVLTFFVILTLYIHLKIIKKREEDSFHKKGSLILGITVLLGFNTHYYYILFLFPLFVVTCVYIHGNKQMIKSYVKSMIVSGIVSLIIWPFSVYHILFGYRGTEAASNILSGGFLGRLYGYAGEFATAFSMWKAWLFLIVLAVALLGLGIYLYNHKNNVVFWLCVLIPSLFYLIIIAQVAPTVSDRYIMCLFPIVAIVLAGVISVIVQRLHLINTIKYAMVVIFAVVMAVIELKCVTPNYLYLEQTKQQLELEYESDKYNCIMVGLTHGQGFSEVLKLSQFKQVLVAGEDEMQYLTKPDDDSENGTVVYVYVGLDSEKYLDYIGDKLDLKSNPIEVDSNIESFRAFIYE